MLRFSFVDGDVIDEIISFRFKSETSVAENMQNHPEQLTLSSSSVHHV